MSVVDFVPQGTLGSELLPKRYDLEIYKGDTPKFTFNLSDTGGPIDFTGATAIVQVKTVAGDGSEGTAVTPGPTVNSTNFATGVVVIEVSVAASNALAVAAAPTYIDGLMWELEVTDSSGNVRTYLGGLIKIYEDVVENLGV